MTADTHTILIVSGGAGTSGEQLVNTVLAQFPEANVRVVIIPHVRSEEQLTEVLQRAKSSQAILVHTLVNADLRRQLVELAEDQGVTAIDLMGSLMDELTQVLGQAPLGQPGLYRQLHQPYFDRVAAIDYSMAHDDGKNPQTWHEAEVLLAGVSRAGKTPLSLYLAVLGWKVANVPIVPGLELAPELYRLDPQRVIGLTIEPGQLLQHRQQRQRQLGVPGLSDYTNPRKIFAELEFAEEIFHRGGFSVIDVTDKPIESSADEVIRLVSGRFKLRDRPG
jgi:regulator of PEP synthase PpsR (kinase-PPPase family)